MWGAPSKPRPTAAAASRPVSYELALVVEKARDTMLISLVLLGAAARRPARSIAAVRGRVAARIFFGVPPYNRRVAAQLEARLQAFAPSTSARRRRRKRASASLVAKASASR